VTRKGIMKRVTLADHGDIGRGYRSPKCLCHPEYPYVHGYSADSGYLEPHADAISWMYLDNPIAVDHMGPTVFDVDYALPPPRRKRLHHHHHHGHHHRSDHERSSSHSTSCIVTECVDSHVFPAQNIFELVQNAGSGNTPFRKVPWHPNLHMLKF
jgi:hypothetical protein